MIQVTYLYHSGFAVELDRHLLVFDYYRGELPAVPEGKKLIIFASHSIKIIFSCRYSSGEKRIPRMPVIFWGMILN